MTLQVKIAPDGRSVHLHDGMWQWRCDGAQLLSYLALLRRLWGRGAKVAGQPGPWARHYAAEIGALEGAVREMEARAILPRAPGFGGFREDGEDKRRGAGG